MASKWLPHPLRPLIDTAVFRSGTLVLNRNLLVICQLTSSQRNGIHWWLFGYSLLPTHSPTKSHQGWPMRSVAPLCSIYDLNNDPIHLLLFNKPHRSSHGRREKWCTGFRSTAIYTFPLNEVRNRPGLVHRHTVFTISGQGVLPPPFLFGSFSIPLCAPVPTSPMARLKLSSLPPKSTTHPSFARNTCEPVCICWKTNSWLLSV